MAQTTNIEMGAPNTRVQQPGSPAPDPADIIFGQRLARVGMPDIFYNPFRDPKESVINFGNLQRMVLHALQRELVKEVAKIETTKVVGMAQAEKIRDTLSKYSSSIRDWELMVDYSKKAGKDPSKDPFVIISSRPLDKALMEDYGLKRSRRTHRSYSGQILPPVPSRTRMHYNKTLSLGAFWKRFYFAMFGGIALVGPMLLMVLYKHRLTSLLTVSVSVFVFGLGMAKYSTANPEGVMAAVAAYAAVLVVFVGTSSGAIIMYGRASIFLL